MRKHGHKTKIFFSALFIIAVNLCFGAFSGKTDDNSNSKFSLKNLNNYSKNYYTLSLLKTSSFQFKGSQELYQQKNANGFEVTSMIRMEKGNTTYVYPYKYKVKVPFFKTPAPPPLH